MPTAGVGAAFDGAVAYAANSDCAGALEAADAFLGGGSGAEEVGFGGADRLGGGCGGAFAEEAAAGLGS